MGGVWRRGQGVVALSAVTLACALALAGVAWRLHATPVHSGAHVGAAAVASAGRRRRGAGGRPAVLLLGDSLVQRSFEPGGWGARLANVLSRRADVVLRGYGGYTSTMLRSTVEKAPEMFPDPAGVALAVVLLGANDASLATGPKAAYSVPVSVYGDNLRALVARLRAGGGRVVLCTPPPVSEEGRLAMDGGPEPLPRSRLDRTLANTGLYAAEARRVAAASGVPVLDLYRVVQEHPGWERELLSDGLHFTPAGQHVVFDALIEVLHEEVPELYPDALPWDTPPHSELLHLHSR